MDSATGDAGPEVKPVKRRRPDRAGKPLSEKELEILHWAKRGKTVWEISVIRSISQATVKFHLANIYAKLQVSNRAQAVGGGGQTRYVALKKGHLTVCQVAQGNLLATRFDYIE